MLEEINTLRKAVERRYFPDHYQYPYRTSEANQLEYQRMAAIDAKTLFCLQTGITAEELNRESEVMEKKREEERSYRIKNELELIEREKKELAFKESHRKLSPFSWFKK